MIFVIKEYYDSIELISLLGNLTRSQHSKFWEFFSAWRIFAEVDGEMIVVRKRATSPYHFALIRKKAGVWSGISCSSTRKYLENERSKYYRTVETQIVSTKIGLIKKREFRSVTEFDLGAE